MRVFLDSNIVLSGLIFRGKPHAILKSAFDPRGHEYVISEDVESEVREVLQETFPRLRREAEEFLSLLPMEVLPRTRYASRIRDVPTLRDQDDAHILAAALAGECDLVVTGDRDLLVIGRVEDIRIVRPAEALRLLMGP